MSGNQTYTSVLTKDITPVLVINIPEINGLYDKNMAHIWHIYFLEANF